MPHVADIKTKYEGKYLKVMDIPALPVALQKVLEIMKKPDVNLIKVAEIIMQDHVLSLKVLKVVNAPAYGFPRRIVSIHNAVMLLGANAVRGILFATVIYETISKSMWDLWEHSLACAIACKLIAKTLRLKGEDEYTLAGLLHDFGKTIVAVQLPDALTQINALVQNSDMLYHTAEERVLGFSHTRINAWVAEAWHVPPSLSAAMINHQNPMCAGAHTTISAVVHLGNFFAHLFEKGFSGDDAVPVLDPLALKHLHIDMPLFAEFVDRIGVEIDRQSGLPVFGR